MTKSRVFALIILVVAALLVWGVSASETASSGFLSRLKFKLGLDLSGGTHLVYHADTSKLASGEVADAMAALRDIIERRVNLFGVSEPLVQTQTGRAESGSGSEQRLIVELPGVTDLDQAIKLIGATPLLEFKLAQANGTTTSYADTGLTGRFLTRATLEFDQRTNAPVIGLEFNSDGAKLFEQITTQNVGKHLAIFLDGAPISIPVINEPIKEGKAVINGQFTPQDAKTLVGRLNSGALPVPIDLISTQKIGATLGASAFTKGVHAGLIGFVLVAIFLIGWYRLPGVVATLALCVYIALMLTLFKLIPVTLTAAGIAGFILSIGMAVDANILIFERMKEELKKGSGLSNAMHEGFARAWPSIRDSNISSMITAVILFWFGTSLVKGFALTFGIGVIVSMFTAITASRLFLYSLENLFAKSPATLKALFGSGIK